MDPSPFCQVFFTLEKIRQWRQIDYYVSLILAILILRKLVYYEGIPLITRQAHKLLRTSISDMIISKFEGRFINHVCGPVSTHTFENI